MTTPLGSSPTQGQVTVHLRFHPGPPLLLLHQVGVLHLRGHRHQPLQGVQGAFSLFKVPEGGYNLCDERMNIIRVTQSDFQLFSIQIGHKYFAKRSLAPCQALIHILFTS